MHFLILLNDSCKIIDPYHVVQCSLNYAHCWTHGGNESNGD